ncbi:MAG: hypothetical protein EXX96DRAFT_613374 [Benjaminiella poitrasii]|nr:MAG: hypothetical protein EXX96DRAFT_613374 [Benjaminiella poitrasii]
MSASTLQYVNPILSPVATEYIFCPKCGVDVTIYSHEDDCPIIRHKIITTTEKTSTSVTTTSTTATTNITASSSQRAPKDDSQWPALSMTTQSQTPTTTKATPSQGKLTQAEAIRTFQSPSNTQGFPHIFLPTKARMPVGQIRSRLRKLNIQNDRILDIHYPTRNVVALIVHNDFAFKLKESLAKYQIATLVDFDPCDR